MFNLAFLLAQLSTENILDISLVIELGSATGCIPKGPYPSEPIRGGVVCRSDTLKCPSSNFVKESMQLSLTPCNPVKHYNKIYFHFFFPSNEFSYYSSA